MKDEKSAPHKRRHYRIVYPAGHRPTIVIEGVKFLVADISERGVRIINDVEKHLPVGTAVEGELFFHDQGTEKVKGTIVRESSTEIMMELSASLHFDRLSEEYRYVEIGLMRAK
jgi:hypothetical protein